MIPSRRHILKLTPALLGLGTVTWPQGAAHGNEQEGDGRKEPPSDRDFVLAAGMTEEEADCWGLINRFAGAILRLPSLRQDGEDHELIHGIHVLQEKMLMRPAYRNYMEAAGGGGRRIEPSDALTHFAHEVDEEAALDAELTDDEVKAWVLLAKVAKTYASLKKLHPVEDHEFAHGLDLLRNRLLMRPTQRHYEEAKGG